MLHCGVVRREARAETRRHHLLTTARTLFVEHGFHQTGIAQIARASGIKVGQIYRDFAGKEEIIAAICEADVAAWLEEDVLAAAVAAGDVKGIRAWLDRFASYDEPLDECRMMAEIIAEAGRNERIAKANQVIDARMRASLTAALSALSSRPADENLALAVDFILALGIGILMRRVMRPDMDVTALGSRIGTIIDKAIENLA